MKITPIDIRQQQFGRRWRGLDAREVDTFLKLVSDELETVLRECNRLREELARSTHIVDEYRERERALKETMITAQKITDDLKDSARKETEIILSEAELQAEKIVGAANRRLIEIIEDINEAKRQREQLHANLAAIIMSHRRLLKELHQEKTEGLFVSAEELRQRRAHFHAAVRELLEAQANLLGLERDQEVDELREEVERLELMRSNLLSRLQGEVDTHAKLLDAREEAESRTAGQIEDTKVKLLQRGEAPREPAAAGPAEQRQPSRSTGTGGGTEER